MPIQTAGEEISIGKVSSLLEHPARKTASSSFYVRIMYTSHASIQGTVQWVDQDRRVSFRSLMELVHLFEEALQTKDGGVQFRSWEEVD